MALDKVSFFGKLVLLANATSDDAQPTPGYMFPDICQITFQSGSQNQDLIDWLDDRLATKSCYTKSKVLRIMKYLVNHGHPDFRQGLRKRSQRISEAIKCSGPPHQLHGNALYLQVRQDAKELSELLFMVSENDSSESLTPSAKKPTGFGMGSSRRGRLEGFGSTPVMSDKSYGESIIDGLRDMAQRVVDLTSDPTDDVTFAPSSSSSISLIPGYRPAAVPDAETSFLESNLNQSLSQPSSRKLQKRHIKGVAGGGWDDEDAGSKLSGSSSRGCPSKNEEKCDSTGCHSETSFSSDKLESETSKTDDCSCERNLVSAIVFNKDNNELIPKRDDIRKFVTSCSNVNCEKIIELICSGLEPRQVTQSMRSMLLLEALLRTDLVSPDFIVTTCGQHLMMLYMDISVDNRVRQKARKIIRILEKLAPSLNSIFCDIGVENKNADTGDRLKPVVPLVTSKTANNDNIINCLLTKSNTEEEDTSSAFPFLTLNSSILSSNGSNLN